VREQARYDELYGKERVDKQNAFLALEDGDLPVWLDERSNRSLLLYRSLLL